MCKRRISCCWFSQVILSLTSKTTCKTVQISWAACYCVRESFINLTKSNENKRLYFILLFYYRFAIIWMTICERVNECMGAPERKRRKLAQIAFIYLMMRMIKGNEIKFIKLNQTRWESRVLDNRKAWW